MIVCFFEISKNLRRSYDRFLKRGLCADLRNLNQEIRKIN